MPDLCAGISLHDKESPAPMESGFFFALPSCFFRKKALVQRMLNKILRICAKFVNQYDILLLFL